MSFGPKPVRCDICDKKANCIDGDVPYGWMTIVIQFSTRDASDNTPKTRKVVHVCTAHDQNKIRKGILDLWFPSAT